jgi:DNA methylase
MLRFKAKDLMMLPELLALSLQADGWFVRSQMPWVKRSAMPESATDRPTSAVEYVFMLTKRARYFWDGEAVKRTTNGNTHSRGTKRSPPIEAAGVGHKDWCAYMTRDEEITTRNFRNSDLFFGSLEAPYGLICDADGVPLALDVNPAAFTGAHFATFPPGLIEPLIRAGTSERGCCAACGAPWVRQTEGTVRDRTFDGSGGIDERKANGRGGSAGFIVTTTTGWRASCSCNADVVPATVLDCFLGSGTTALVADRLGRDAIGIELNPAYAEMARARIKHDAGLFAEFDAQPPTAEPQDAPMMADLFAWAAAQ